MDWRKVWRCFRNSWKSSRIYVHSENDQLTCKAKSPHLQSVKHTHSMVDRYLRNNWKTLLLSETLLVSKTNSENMHDSLWLKPQNIHLIHVDECGSNLFTRRTCGGRALVGQPSGTTNARESRKNLDIVMGICQEVGLLYHESLSDESRFRNWSWAKHHVGNGQCFNSLKLPYVIRQ